MKKRHEAMCAPGVQNEICRICGNVMMEGNAARWAHDQCIENERKEEGNIYIPSPLEIAEQCAMFQATRLEDRITSTAEYHMTFRQPPVHKLHDSSRRGRAVQ